MDGRGEGFEQAATGSTAGGRDGATTSRRAALLATALVGLGALPARAAAAQTPDAERGGGWVAIRTYQLKEDADRVTLLTLTEESFVPLLRDQPGFVAFYVLEPDPLTWMGITVWQTEEAAAASAAVAGDWVGANVQAAVASGPESVEARVDLVAFAVDGATPAA